MINFLWVLIMKLRLSQAICQKCACSVQILWRRSPRINTSQSVCEGTSFPMILNDEIWDLYQWGRQKIAGRFEVGGSCPTSARIRPNSPLASVKPTTRNEFEKNARHDLNFIFYCSWPSHVHQIDWPILKVLYTYTFQKAWIELIGQKVWPDVAPVIILLPKWPYLDVRFGKQDPNSSFPVPTSAPAPLVCYFYSTFSPGPNME